MAPTLIIRCAPGGGGGGGAADDADAVGAGVSVGRSGAWVGVDTGAEEAEAEVIKVVSVIGSREAGAMVDIEGVVIDNGGRVV